MSSSSRVLTAAPRITSMMKACSAVRFLGNEISSLVNEEKKPGEYEIEFSTVALPSGIYFYKLSTGGFSITRKMLLLK
jgi:hypothetical protein